MTYDLSDDEEPYLEQSRGRRMHKVYSLQTSHEEKSRYNKEQSPLDDKEITATISNIRNKARNMTNFFLDDCDAIKERSKSKDCRTLSQIDDILKETKVQPKYPIRRATYGSFSSKDSHTGLYSSRKYEEEEVENEPIDADVNARVKERMRHVEEHLDGILDFEIPTVVNFKAVRSILNGINEKIATHKILVDRYSGLDLKEIDQTTEERIEKKFDELVERNPRLVSRREYESKGHSSAFIPGYITGTSVTQNDKNVELRKRIRSLVCRTRGTSVNPEMKT